MSDGISSAEDIVLSEKVPAGKGDSRAKWLKLVGQVLLIFVIGYFFSKNIYDNWSAVEGFDWRFDMGQLAISIGLGLIGFALFPVGVVESVAIFGNRLTYRQTFKMYFYSQMTKYIPGGFWVVLSRTYLYSKEGISRYSGSVSLLVEIILQINASLIVFLSTYLLFGQSRLPYKFAAFFVYLTATLVFLHPRVFRFFHDKIFSRFTKGEVAAYSYLRILRLQLVFVVYWLFLGFAFYFFLKSIGIAVSASLGYLIGIFPGAWAVGFLSFITPGGMGVRESFMTFLLNPILPLTICVVIALLARLWWILLETCCVAISSRL